MYILLISFRRELSNIIYNYILIVMVYSENVSVKIKTPFPYYHFYIFRVIIYFLVIFILSFVFFTSYSLLKILLFIWHIFSIFIRTTHSVPCWTTSLGFHIIASYFALIVFFLLEIFLV